jgi:4-hydroxymandelate oxidase
MNEVSSMSETDLSPHGATTRRGLLRGLTGALVGGAVAAPLLAQNPPVVATPAAPHGADESRMVRPPDYSDDIMRVINLHEFEGVAKKKISSQAYDYIAAGAADELTLRANRAAFADYWIRRRVMVDVSNVDTSVELLGQTLAHPILLGPVGLRRLMNPDGDRLTLLAAHESKAVVVGPNVDLIGTLAKQNRAPMWWAAALGLSNKADTEQWVKQSTDAGASALCVSVDYPITGARDRPSRDHWESQWADTGRYNTGGGVQEFQAGMLFPYNNSMNWERLSWVTNASKLPLVVKGITTAEDAKLALQHGAAAISVSNHGGRTLDGAVATLHALPEVVEAVNGKVPVLVDGGVRRGGDIIKAAALGARAIMIGRPYLWGLAAFGQIGVQRVIELLQGELRIALGLSGAGNLRAIDRSLIRPAWHAYDRPHTNDSKRKLR